MVLNEQDKEKLIKNNKVTIDLHGKKYFVKRTSGELAANELIGNKLCSILGINCANVEVFFLGGTYYVISEEIPNFKDGEHFNLLVSNIPLILRGLASFYYNIDVITEQLIKMYFFDIMFLNSDRGFNNWGIEEINFKGNLVAIDHELLFSDDYPIQIRGSLKSIKDSLKDKDSILNYNIKDLEVFLANNEKYWPIFLEMYKKVPPELLKDIIYSLDEFVLKNINIDGIINMYTKNYEKLTMLVEQRGIAR